MISSLSDKVQLTSIFQPIHFCQLTQALLLEPGSLFDDRSSSLSLWNESPLEDSASERLERYSWTRASRKLNTLSSSDVIFLGVKPIDDNEAEPSPLLAVRIDELPEELEEKLLDVELLRASLDERLAFRRWAKRALHTSWNDWNEKKISCPVRQVPCKTKRYL